MPRKSHPEDQHGNLSAAAAGRLPVSWTDDLNAPDLVELAEQLSLDARFLASRYPAQLGRAMAGEGTSPSAARAVRMASVESTACELATPVELPALVESTASATLVEPCIAPRADRKLWLRPLVGAAACVALLTGMGAFSWIGRQIWSLDPHEALVGWRDRVSDAAGALAANSPSPSARPMQPWPDDNAAAVLSSSHPGETTKHLPSDAIPAGPQQSSEAATFHHLSGPEQEAVLDLLEDQPLGQASLSI